MNRTLFARAQVFAVCLFAAQVGHAVGQARYILEKGTSGAFPIVQSKTASAIYVDSNDWAGVARAAGDLRADIARVTGITPPIAHDEKSLGAHAIIAGAIGKSPIIDQLIREKRIDAGDVAGRWEAFVIQVVSKPLRGVSDALIIAGSDKRGAIYGIYDLSEQIGVSPWYWWADVPVVHKDTLFVKAGRYVEGEPAVKYRGIFLNDEAPALSGWVKEKYGTWTDGRTALMNHEFYSRVFELILRLKGNYLWPAMWANAFNEDDPLNPKVADEYGIVMGTSHHEPMLRAQQEWKRHGTGPWDYSKNAEVLRNFWQEGVRRNKDYESIITIGMRGDGDMPMAGTSLEANVSLLEQIVADQRKIIAQQVNPDVTKVPQLWALYKEVQSYYEKGMRVPDDVTLLWCDDNWGDIRRLPTDEERKRSGGAGIYYHFDYVGGPRNYKWIDTNPIPKIWEQMNLALSYGADRIWIVNVGDLKPMEFPIEFFLNLARDPGRWPKEKLSEFTRLWAEREFGTQYAADIADLVSKYLKYNGRRKPELLEPATFSLTDYQEADRVAADFDSLVSRAEKIQAALPENARDAFFELVVHPAKAYAQVAELYIAAARNRLYAAQARATANDYAARTKALFQADADLSDYYNHMLLNGKWNHMMDQTHIGYTYWQEPPRNTMPAVREIELPEAADMGVAVEGSAAAWPGAQGDPVLPGFDAFNRQRRYIDVFDKGKAPFDFTATASDPWIKLSAERGAIEKEQRLWVSVDWSKAPPGSSQGSVRIARSGGNEITVRLSVSNPQSVTRTTLKGFVEADGYVSMEAEHYTRKVDAPTARWEKIDDYGRTLSAMSVFPVTGDPVVPRRNSPCLEYQMYLFDAGKAEVDAVLSPSLNFMPGRGLRFAVSFDDEEPQVVDAIGPIAGRDNLPRDWETIVKDSARHVKITLNVATPGYHTLKLWMVDRALVLEKVVVDQGGVKPSYLGPPESYRSEVGK
ncbi:MAG TPA: glycosyl hydrolase 115 family protein [Bryobacteraceae bacterium]|nr:glycosyl hydrolase 115 family protein [Bryobacteraceae bacterium]